MSDSIFEIGAIVDTAALNSGFDESTAATQAFVDGLNVMFDEAGGKSARTFSGISNDIKQMAANVTPAQIELSAAIQRVSDAQKELARTTQLLKSPMVEAAVSARLHAAALQELGNAQDALKVKTQALTGAEEQLAVASHSVVSGQQAASAAIRTLEGNAGIRAVENFIAKTLGLGPILQAVFPVIGALAFGKILFDIGEKIYEVEQKAEHAADAINHDFAELNDELRSTVLELTVTADKIEDANAKLEKKPGNGLRTGIDEAEQAAEKLGSTLDKDLDKIKEIAKKNEVGFWGGLFSNTAETGDTSKMLINAKQSIDAIRHDYDAVVQQARESGDPANIAQAEEQKTAALIKVYAEQTKKIEAARAAAQQMQEFHESSASKLGVRETQQGGGVTFDSGADQKANLALLSQAGKVLEQEQEEIGESMRKGVAESQHSILEEQKKGGDGQKKAAEEQMKSFEFGMAEMKADHDVSVGEEYEYWSKLRAASSTYADNLPKVTEKVGQLYQEMGRKIDEAIKQAVEAQKKKEEQDKKDELAFEKLEKMVQQTDDDITQSGPHWDGYWSEVAKGEQVATRIADSFALAQAKASEAAGGVSKLSLAQMEATIHTREHIAALKALEDELLRLQIEGMSLNPGDKGYEENQQKQQGVKNQITQQQGQGATQAVTDRANIAANISKPYLTAFNTINNGWLKVQNDLIAGNRNIGQDFRRMGLTMVQDLAKGFEQMLANSAKFEIQKIATHRAANLATNAADAAAAATSTGVAKSQNASQGLDAAKLAFKNTYAVVSKWPVVGPALAPVLASGAFAAVAAFEQGTMMVPRTGMAVLHPGEAVLGSPAAGVMREMMNGGGSGAGGDTHFHMGGNQFSGAGGDFHSQFEAHEKKITRTLQKWNREGKLNPKKGR